MIDVRELTKRYGATRAVDGLSFQVRPGHVTGFLGPNGAGKSTTMRAVLGLDAPTSGEALVNGRRYATIRRPAFVVGALLDAGAAHGGRTALNHLRCLGRSNGIGRARAEEVLGQVGLSGVADRRVRSLSLGMRQRLGIAVALLGDPAVLLFDEPVNGLDPEGVRWIRDLLRSLAAQGRTVLVSSHLMSEMALTADRVIVIGRGRLILESSVRELADRHRRDVLVRSPRAADLADALVRAGAEVDVEHDGLVVRGLDTGRIAEVAAQRSVPVHELTPRGASLEDAYLELTGDTTEHRDSGRTS
ncbi:ABC transporter ATP-binding protein [Umezawaea beigongshangensis]|uniref:ABC transporter ATP-binding protein n=1 Tax=Umezawaea beigongshangensis TaxID=2780383 RepID=UPI0018F1ED2B|nr:ATP-binding cassette domain-containing protein [Umezawaea beigongshangensis]